MSFLAWMIMVTGAAAAAGLGYLVWVAWRRTKRLLSTLDAAQALIDVHSLALQKQVDDTAARAERVQKRIPVVQAQVDAMLISLRELGYLGSLVGREKRRLRRSAVNVLLPMRD